MKKQFSFKSQKGNVETRARKSDSVQGISLGEGKSEISSINQTQKLEEDNERNAIGGVVRQ